LYRYQKKRVTEFDGWKWLKIKRFRKCVKSEAIRKSLKMRGEAKGSEATGRRERRGIVASLYSIFVVYTITEKKSRKVTKNQGKNKIFGMRELRIRSNGIGISDRKERGRVRKGRKA
jgi:hypothetical protein